MIHVQVTLVTDSESQGSQPHVPHALKNFGLTQKQNTLKELARDLWLDMPADGLSLQETEAIKDEQH
jgi:hypothetical protein